MPFLNAPRKNIGFTLIELLVIVLIVGILSAITIPSFINIVDRVNLNNAVTEVRTALRTGQREAIRRSQICTVGLNAVERTVTSYCSSDENNLPNRVDIATNISENPSLPDKSIKIDFSVLGTAKFTLDAENNQASKTQSRYLEMSWQQLPNPPDDPSGKIVFYIVNNPTLVKKCIAISNTLGLTRIGNYTGKVAGTYKLTQKGICTAS